MTGSSQRNKYQIGQHFIPFKNFIGPVIPLPILKCSVLTPTAKLLWAQLAMHAGKNGKCYPGQDTLAKELAVSKRKIQRSIKLLEKERFIEIIRPKNRRSHSNNNYVFLWHEIFNQSDDNQLLGDNLAPNNQLDDKNDNDQATKTSVLGDKMSSPIKEINKEKNDEKATDIIIEKSSDFGKAKSTATPENIMRFWNEYFENTPVHTISKLTADRIAKLNDHIKDFPKTSDWIRIFRKIKATPYLLGEKGWKVSFDWLIENDEHITKVRDGNYDKYVPESKKRLVTEDDIPDFIDERRPVCIVEEYAYDHDLYSSSPFKKVRPEYKAEVDAFNALSRKIRAEWKGKTIAELEEMFPVKKV